jgi:uncharacterized RmlC-like cupin family protein
LSIGGSFQYFDNTNKIARLPLIPSRWSPIPIVQLSKIFSVIENGNTFIITNFSRETKKLNDFIGIIENALATGHVDAHVYASFETGNSFNAHFDESSNIIFQLDGECQWVIYKDFGIDDIKNECELTVCKTFTLKPGDLIYIPSKQYHKCIPKSKRISVSCPISIDNISYKIEREWYNLK